MASMERRVLCSGDGEDRGDRSGGGDVSWWLSRLLQQPIVAQVASQVQNKDEGRWRDSHRIKDGDHGR